MKDFGAHYTENQTSCRGKMNNNPLHICDDDKTAFYGGDQAWFKENTRYFGGCGSVAAVNVLRSLAAKKPDIFNSKRTSDDFDAYTKKNLNHNEYRELMCNLYKAIGSFEVPIVNRIYNRCRRDNKLFKRLIPTFGVSINRFVRRFMSYCRKNGLLLHCHSISTTFCSYDKGLDFIREGLEKGNAVVIMTSFNKHPLNLHSRYGQADDLVSRSSMKSHFATITEVTEDNMIHISTWGKHATVKYDDLYKSWQSRKAFTSSLIFFEPTESDRQCRSDIRFSVRLVLKSYANTLIGRNLL